MTIRVVLADDQALVRAGFRSLLETTDDIVVVGEATDGDEAVARALTTQPDVVLMDIRMPGTDGLEATRNLTGHPDLHTTRVIVLTTYEMDEYVFEALRSGASGFLTKDVEPGDLRDAVRIVAAGNALLSPTVTRRVVDAFAKRTTPRAAPELLGSLTDREREVFAAVGAGMSNAEIGEHLYMSPLTAKTHVSRILDKLGARDRVQLVVLAHEAGIAGP